MDAAPRSLEVTSYDRWFDSTWGGYAFGVERRALGRVLGDLSGARVLDAGCGTGRFTRVLEEAGARVIGLDVDPAMARFCAGRTRGPVVVGDVRRLPFRAGCFDVSVAVTLLEFVDDPQQAVAELMRATRPRGRVVLALLNPASLWGMASARRRRRGPWASSHMLAASRVAAWCRPYGTVRRHGALFAPRVFPGIGRLGPALEMVGRLFSRRGAFQLLVVEKR